jgi:predicted O-linked N-acetylglucosamine transferase (SPINDLY family)
VCPQTLFKFHPDFDDILARILHEDRRGLLVLIEGGHPNWAKLLLERFARAFPNDVDRVRFLPQMPTLDFLSLLTLADVLLDTIHFCGGNTSLESFAFGIPIVTLPGKFLRGRLTLALYQQMGVMDCVAENAESYVNIALRLANDRRWRDAISSKINSRAHVLYEDIEAVRELEHFFEWAADPARKRK